MKKDIDVSVLKDNDLDNTASFIDLMSRSQRRNREIEKKQKQEELKNILFKEDSKKVKNEKKDLKRKEALNKIARSGVEYQKFNLENTTRFDDIKESVLENVEDNINKESNKYGIGNILVTGILIILSLGYFIYSILFTNIQVEDTNLLIDGGIILGMIMVFCISIVCGKILYKVLSVLNYLLFIGYIIFNILLVSFILILSFFIK